jgi:hypothetical protein
MNRKIRHKAKSNQMDEGFIEDDKIVKQLFSNDNHYCYIPAMLHINHDPSY